MLIDRVYNADDNAERLFEYLRAERPDVNAWFVLEKDSPDWRRLRAAGVDRLVPFGSFTLEDADAQRRWLLSSHADVRDHASAPGHAAPEAADLAVSGSSSTASSRTTCPSG